MTTLLAFESIVPVIGGAVLTGAFSFFGGVLLGRKRLDTAEEKIETSSLLESDFDPLVAASQRSVALTGKPSVDQFLRNQEVYSSFSSFLKWIVPDPARGFAAIVRARNDCRFTSLAEGLSNLSVEQLVVPKNLLSRLSSTKTLVLESELDSDGLVRWLDENDRAKVQKLCLTALDDGTQITAVLITSAPWPASVSRAEQQEVMTVVAKAIGQRWHQMLALEQQSRELRLTRDMLELRSIVDSQVEEPIEILNEFASRLCDMVFADRVAIFFVARRSGEQLQPIVQCGRAMPVGFETAWESHELTLAKATIESESGGVRNENRWHEVAKDSPVLASVSMPIRVNGRVLGALCLTCQDQHGTLERSRRIIEYAAEILSQTLRRVFDEATIRRQAHHDHLTDLVNRRSLDAYLDAEVNRIRNGDSGICSLILADLDRFKSINDTFGHQSGDHVLRECARVLSEQVAQLRTGEHSIVARYGGEEFAILLPNVGLQGAVRIAEAMRAAIESEQIYVQNKLLKVTVSLGVAACPEQAITVESLISAADKALYLAKSSGRNMVCRADSIKGAGNLSAVR